MVVDFSGKSIIKFSYIKITDNFPVINKILFTKIPLVSCIHLVVFPAHMAHVVL